MLLTVIFFVVFKLAIQMAKFGPTKSSDQILLINMLQIWNLRYFRHCWIIKCVGLEPIIFSINMDSTSSSKVLALMILCFY